MHKTIYLTGVAALLAGCGGGGTSSGATPMNQVQTSASFQTPDAAGAFPDDLDNELARVVLDSANNGYAYQYGDTDNVLTARAGIVPGTSVASAPASGTADLTGVYQVRTVTDAVVGSDGIEGADFFQTSLITLTADFGEATLRGDASNLEVDGSFASGTLTGEVTFNGLTAALTGIVGADQAVGAFQGSTEDSIIVGGFNVTD